MQLTDQMEAELDDISEYLKAITPIRSLITSEICKMSLTTISVTYITENAKLLSSHKVRLENFLCETDSKERDY